MKGSYRTRLSLLLLVLVAVVYASSVRNGFHLDDFHSVVNNPHIRQLSAVPAFFGDAGMFSVNPGSAMYRPLLLSTFAVDYALFGGSAAGYHAVNILLHGLVAITLLWWLGGMGVPARVALWTVLLFALHPINSEAVCYISSRSEVLMALFVLSAGWVHVRYRAGAGPHLLPVGAALVGAGLLSKSVAIITPVATALMDGFSGGLRRVRSGLPAYAALAVPCLLYLVSVRGSAARALVDAPVRNPAVQLWTQAKAQIYYLQLLVMPVQLNVEHQFDVARSAQPVVLLSVALIGSIAVVAWRLRRQIRVLLFGLGWWALVLLPTTVVPLIVLVNEHRLYLAGPGVFLPVAWCLRRLAESRSGHVHMATVVPVLYTIVLALLTTQRVPDWHDEVTLWRDAAAKAPLMLRPHLRLADALVERGRLPEAEASYKRAIELRPRHVASRNNLGLFYRQQGRLPEAEAQFSALLAASPDNVPARLNLAEIDLMQGRWQQAYASYDTSLMHGDTRGRAQVRMGQIALQFRHDARLALSHFDAGIAAGADQDADAHVGRGVALRALGLDSESLAAYQRATAIAPERADVWYNLGNLYAAGGQAGAARSAFGRVIDLAPGDDLARRAQRQIEGLQALDGLQSSSE